MQSELPENVQRISSFLKEKNVWFSLTQNKKCEGCADAASKRNRLGHIGIPLSDELKSNFGFYLLNNERNYVLIHCRGNQNLDKDKVTKLLGSEFIRLKGDNQNNKYNFVYGTVNPFLFAIDHPEIEQVFDASIMEVFWPPYTIMTNAGNGLWGIEIKARELIPALPKTRISDIITNESKILVRKHKIGILTGNSPESGIFLWQKINETIRQTLDRREDFLGDLSFPTVLVESIPEMGLSMELDNRLAETWQIVEEGITSLCKNGATIIGIACNTTQFFSEKVNDICKSFRAEYFSMADVVNEFLEKEHIEHFDFIGIKFVTDFSKWSDYRKLNDHYKIEIPSEEIMKEIAYEGKMTGISNKGLNRVRDLITRYTKTDNIIIALTEVSILLPSIKRKKRDNRRYIDTLTLLADKMAERYLKDYSEMVIVNQKAISDKENHNDHFSNG